MEKINAELVTLTYGTIVAQLCKDFDSDYAEVNKQLDKMGYNIGLRLIEDFMARSSTGRCANFRETGEAIAKVIICTIQYCQRRSNGINSNADSWFIDWIQGLSEHHAHRLKLE